MRDYKNVRVPRTYRARAPYRTVKRVNAGSGAHRSGAASRGVGIAARQFLVVVVICAAAWLGLQAYRLITHAAMFQIAGVDVSGAKQLGESELREIVGAFTGQNIFRADLDAAIRRAQANAWVKEARIHRRLPNRISMVFVERVPAAVLDTGKMRYLLDNEGVVLERFRKEQASAWALPVIAIKDPRVKPGDQVASDGVSEAFTLIAEIAARGGWKLPDVLIKADSVESLAVVYGGCEFKIGNGSYSEKLRRLVEVMADVKQRGLDIAYVDLRPERQAAVMLKDSGVKGPGEKHSSKFRVHGSGKRDKI
ncbi:MAG TPA: FtsQ-type POTRA domain-containing protein [Nitrospirota bacterium]